MGIRVTSRITLGEDKVKIAASIDREIGKHAAIRCADWSGISRCNVPSASSVSRAGELNCVQRPIRDESCVKISVEWVDNEIALHIHLIKGRCCGDFGEARKGFAAVGRLRNEQTDAPWWSG